MELINIDRILPKNFIDQIDQYCEVYAGGEKHKVIYGQLFIGSAPPADERVVHIITEMVCEYFKSTKSIVLSNTRKQPYMKHRQVIIYMIEKYTSMTYAHIATVLGYSNHSIIVHSLRTVRQDMLQDSEFAKSVMSLDQRFEFLITSHDKENNQ